ncbi:alpha/beta hydrolase fold domain-containing protein [Methylosinus sporium]|uniref:Alpha/beta hydrolase n=1 Tax=Methylosinus sporium TaxID=428 RepID=A0A2U1SWB1_METSR|nr:alpha/beta hydrolase fold domain-containing protein [Methylosinus sporium]PWB95896.1 alpha/beta hydrolase [Methylosinus sporium]
MASLAAHLSRAVLRRSLRPRLCGEAGDEAAVQALNLRWPWPPAGAAETDPQTPGEWVRTGSAEAATLLYLHGGAFMAGSPRLYRSTARFFARAGFDVFTPAYRLAPAHRFPAALDDVTAAYERLAALGPLMLAGDSAGGGLALALMLRLRARGLPLPRAAALFSPWTDLSASGASTRDNEGKDPIFTRRALRLAARQYLGEASTRELEASPLFGDLSGLPPLLLHVGADELLLDDSRRLAERAAAAGTKVELTIFASVPHGWQLGVAFMPEARASLREAAAFLARYAGD